MNIPNLGEDPPSNWPILELPLRRPVELPPSQLRSLPSTRTAHHQHLHNDIKSKFKQKISPNFSHSKNIADSIIATSVAGKLSPPTTSEVKRASSDFFFEPPPFFSFCGRSPLKPIFPLCSSFQVEKCILRRSRPAAT